MTRLFLKSDAVFKAYEENEQQQRNAATQRIKRYTSVDLGDEPAEVAKILNVGIMF
jgi:hypothetical protein